MKKTRKGESPTEPDARLAYTLGQYAYHIIEEQFQRILKQERRVLEDKSPEALHQMRVGTRRLRTALQIFDAVVKLPKAASAKQLRDFARVLGQVRDLDVQMASLREDYQPHLNKREQKQLDKALSALEKQRRHAVSTMKDFFNGSRYESLKSAFKAWLEKPVYQSIESLPIAAVLPDLLNPLLSELFLHPGWLISTQQATGGDGESLDDREILHDLRKVCKHVRYQAEFFTIFYETAFEDWIQEIKTLQDRLGEFQDTQVLIHLLDTELGKTEHLPALLSEIQKRQAAALADWETQRQQYLDIDFRNRLRYMILQASGVSSHDLDLPATAALN